MTTTTPTYALARTFDTDDLRALVERPSPFLTVCLRAPTRHDHDGYRFELGWQQTRRTIEHDWPAERLAALDDHLAALDHGRCEAVVVIQSNDGHIFTEFLTLGIAEDRADISPVPRLIAIIEHRQRTQPHVVVETDRTGADIVAFSGGGVVGSEQVEGETFQIHRGHPGGWSQHHYQQRAENTWETNAGDVATAAIGLAEQVGAVAVLVAGEVRARSLVTDALAGRDFEVVNIDAGDADGIAEATLRALSDHHARAQREVINQLRDATATHSNADEVRRSLELGQVDTLFVNDRGLDEATRAVVDTAVTTALSHGANVIVLPTVAEMHDGLACINRW